MSGRLPDHESWLDVILGLGVLGGLAVLASRLAAEGVAV